MFYFNDLKLLKHNNLALDDLWFDLICKDLFPVYKI